MSLFSILFWLLVMSLVVYLIGHERGGHRNSYDNSYPPPPTFKQGYSRYNSFDSGRSGGYQHDGPFHRNNSYHGSGFGGGYGGRRASEPSPFYRYNSESSNRFSDCKFINNNMITIACENIHNVVGYITQEEWTKALPRNERMERYGSFSLLIACKKYARLLYQGVLQWY